MADIAADIAAGDREPDDGYSPDEFRVVEVECAPMEVPDNVPKKQDG